MKERIPKEAYYRYKSAIETANELKDKESLRKIQMQLIAGYGLDNDDVNDLLKLFYCSV